jgi:transcriptional regulator with XRE-family HTH domain
MDDTQDDFYLEVGKLIREERDTQGLTQEDLATKTSLTRNMIANIETGRQQVSLYTFISIAKGLNLKFEDLLPKNKIDKDNVKQKLSSSAASKKIFKNFFDESKIK